MESVSSSPSLRTTRSSTRTISSHPQLVRKRKCTAAAASEGAATKPSSSSVELLSSHERLTRRAARGGRGERGRGVMAEGSNEMAVAEVGVVLMEAAPEGRGVREGAVSGRDQLRRYALRQTQVTYASHGAQPCPEAAAAHSPPEASWSQTSPPRKSPMNADEPRRSIDFHCYRNRDHSSSMVCTCTI